MREDLFFGLHLNLGAKFRTEIKLLCLTKFLKNILPPQNLLNQQKIDAYHCFHYSVSMDISNTPSFEMFLTAILYVKQMQKSKLRGKYCAVVQDRITTLIEHLK